MSVKKILRESLISMINETNDVWYHGTSDVRELEQDGGFSERIISVEYVNDIDMFNEIQDKLTTASQNGDNTEYHNLLNMVGKLKSNYKMKKPIFLTNKYDVAKTYADPSRAYDYQNSVEKILKVSVNSSNSVTITAIGDRFRFIGTDKVMKGFISAGIPVDEFNKVLSMFNFYVSDKTKIKTDVIAAIGQWFGFDSIDVIGVLDSYAGGNIQSTVKMVFDNKNIKII